MSNKKLRIEKLNDLIRSCRKCRLSETKHNAIVGEGNLDSRLMLIAQAPGNYEDCEGKMFIGPSGKILDELLNSAGVRRKDTYMTNLIKCVLPNYRKPKQDEIKTCTHYLDEEINIIHPEILVPLGYYAFRYLQEKYNFTEISKEELLNINARLILAGKHKIFPLRHPVTILYNNNIREEMMKNYNILRVLQRECKWYPVCPIRSFYDEGKLDAKWVELYCKGNWESCIRYQMEEAGKYHPDWMLPDGSLDERLKS